jgi:hypothetical protein
MKEPVMQREMPAVPALTGVVVYRSRGRGYQLAATITATRDTLDPVGVQRGDVPDLTTAMHVHLHVMTPGVAKAYTEHYVPYDPAGSPGTWCWPPI